METQKMIDESVELLREYWNPFATWNDAITVKSTPHNEICRLYGAGCDVNNNLRLFDGENWYKLEAADTNAKYVASSVLQRLKILKSLVNK